ncbi:MAG: helix-turn-helix transcriptional regulator [Anaerolineae bacterium]|nr:helix-turn-helix transcriptional regulator [Anaerolineae bacterium]
MDLICDERASDSPYVERIWRSRSEHESEFLSVAESHWEMVVTRYQGQTTLTVRGPETKATSAYCPAGGEWIGIQFKSGAFMPDFPARMVMDRQDVNLPEASSGSFWLKGSAWHFPNYENADTFVDWLADDGLLVRDPVIGASLRGEHIRASSRTMQRRFLRATGLTQGTIDQIKRARYATILLKQGVSILDAVYRAGYTDQPHMTRALKHYVGQTPAQIAYQNTTNPLSLLYRTEPY